MDLSAAPSTPKPAHAQSPAASATARGSVVLSPSARSQKHAVSNSSRRVGRDDAILRVREKKMANGSSVGGFEGKGEKRAHS